MPRVMLIVNPRASRVSEAGSAAVAATLERGCDLVVARTERRGHASELAAAAAGEADAVVVFSGDGTYNEAINGAGGQLPFGFIPGGGASVFPRALGLPRDPTVAAERVLQALQSGRRRVISLGTINGRRFCSSAGLGFDAEVVRRVEARGRDRDGRRAGTAAFIASTVQALRESRFRLAPQLELEGVGRAAAVVVVNGAPYTYAGALPVALAPRAEFEGGLDYVALRSIRPRDALPITLAVVRGRLDGDERAFTGHDVEGLSVRCDRPLPAQADGEDLGDLEQVDFGLERGALEVLC